MELPKMIVVVVSIGRDCGAQASSEFAGTRLVKAARIHRYDWICGAHTIPPPDRTLSCGLNNANYKYGEGSAISPLLASRRFRTRIPKEAADLML
jgi:hypothetical protein